MGPRTLPATPSLVETLVLAQRRAVRGLAARLADDGCTLDQWRVLRALDDDEGHVMGELADSLQIAQPTLTRVVDGLVDSAWVYRRPSLEDRRRVAVHLSRQGRVRLGRLDAIVRAHEDALRASPDWADVQSLISGLSRTP
ncbi:MAG TPA: MarR family transcriptional regulator [Nocardioidaceae bacterium]|jgi:DNA-binding MarR family transcriptional regulator|nr:MarR family transcriptional regulator [Nocardioidaceae bacterium]